MILSRHGAARRIEEVQRRVDCSIVLLLVLLGIFIVSRSQHSTTPHPSPIATRH